MVTVSLYGPTGLKKGQVSMDLSKADCGWRILKAIRDSRPGWTLKSLEMLDSGRLAPSHIFSLYSPDEVKAAIRRRIEAIGQEGDELQALEALLHDSGWTDALGGPAASKTREAGMVRQWMNVQGAKKSGDLGNNLRKSRRVGNSGDILVGFGWETSATERDQRGRLYRHHQFPGHIIEVEHATDAWTHLKGAREISRSIKKGAAPVVSAADLMAHLTRLHHSRDTEDEKYSRSPR